MRKTLLVACLSIFGIARADNPEVITIYQVTQVEGHGDYLVVYSPTLPHGSRTYTGISGTNGGSVPGNQCEARPGGDGKRFHFRNDNPCETLVVTGTFDLSGGQGGDGLSGVIGQPPNVMSGYGGGNGGSFVVSAYSVRFGTYGNGVSINLNGGRGGNAYDSQNNSWNGVFYLSPGTSRFAFAQGDARNGESGGNGGDGGWFALHCSNVISWGLNVTAHGGNGGRGGGGGDVLIGHDPGSTYPNEMFLCAVLAPGDGGNGGHGGSRGGAAIDKWGVTGATVPGSINAKSGNGGDAGNGGSQILLQYNGTNSPQSGYHVANGGAPALYGIAGKSGRAGGVSGVSGSTGNDSLATTSYLAGTRGYAEDGLCWNYSASGTCLGWDIEDCLGGGLGALRTTRIHEVYTIGGAWNPTGVCSEEEF